MERIMSPMASLIKGIFCATVLKEPPIKSEEGENEDEGGVTTPFLPHMISPLLYSAFICLLLCGVALLIPGVYISYHMRVKGENLPPFEMDGTSSISLDDFNVVNPYFFVSPMGLLIGTSAFFISTLTISANQRKVDAEEVREKMLNDQLDILGEDFIDTNQWGDEGDDETDYYNQEEEEEENYQPTTPKKPKKGKRKKQQRPNSSSNKRKRNTQQNKR